MPKAPPEPRWVEELLLIFRASEEQTTVDLLAAQYILKAIKADDMAPLYALAAALHARAAAADPKGAAQTYDALYPK